MNHVLLSIILCCLGLFQALGQDIVFDGKISDLETGKSLGGVAITAKAGGSEVASTTTGSNGKYTINVPVGKLYVIEYVKSGYVTKVMKIHTEGITDEDLPIGGRVMPAVDIDLFTKKEAVDFSFMKQEPVVEWNWDAKKLRMDWDKKVYKEMKDKIDDLLKEAEEKEQQNDAKYNELIAEADNLFKDKNYQESLNKYEAAVKIPGKEMEEYPNKRILELDDLLQAEAKEALKKEQSGEKYKETIAEAESLRASENYDKAIDKFYEALDLKPDEVYPLDQIDELNVLLKEKENKKEYDQLVKMGDDFLEQNSLKSAKDKFEKASQLMPDESYPKEQLKIIEEKSKAAEEEQLLKQKYDEAIKAADAYFDKEDYENAKQKYEEAIGYESAASYPKQKLKIVNEKLAELAQEAAKEVAYDSLIVLADEALKNSQYVDAITQYEAALTIKNQDSYALAQKEKANTALEELKDGEALEAKINELLAEAEKDFQAEEYASAIDEFAAVLALDDANQQAIEGKEKSEKALADQEANAALKESFDEKVAEADKLFEDKELETAKKAYEAANAIIPNDEHVKAQLEKVENAIKDAAAQEELEGQLESILTKAKKEVEKENWQNAIDKYEEALSLDAENEEALSGKEAALAALKAFEESQSVEEQFEKLTNEADQLFQKKKYEAAKEKYEEAIAVKEDKTVADKIEEIETLLAELAAKEVANENYKTAIETGDQAMSNNSFDNAIEAYEEALSIKEADKAATKKLEKAKNLKEQYETFEQLKKEGAELVAAESWEEAKEKYLEAKAINADDTVLSQLELINKKLNALASQEELEEQYQALIAEAETLESSEAYDEAIKKFEQALEVKKDDAFAVENIERIKELKLELEKAAAADAGYQEKISAGNKALEKEDYAEAIEAFDDALEFKPDDSEALSLKTKAKKALSELAKNEEAYQELLADAKSKREEGELEEAKAMYKEAQGRRPKDAIPQNAIVEIDELLRVKEESADNDALYKAKIDEADSKAEDLKYEEAIDLFKEASKIKPAEDYPKKRVEEVQALLDQMMAKSKKDNAYDDKVSEADAAFDNTDYEEAIDLYKQALLIDNSATYPTDQIARAEAKLKSLEEDQMDSEFQLVMKKGNGAFANEDYAEAIAFYTKALNLKPNNQEAKDRKAEAEALIEQAFSDELADKQNKEKYDKIIAEADNLFDKEDYIDAKDKYEAALTQLPGDRYAIDRIEESVRLAQEKVKEGDDERYQKIVDKADEYFEAENYDKATSLYQRALGLRSKDPYPTDRLEEIERILAGDVKVEKGLEYLGEPEDISVIEGSALLENAEKQRQNLKSQRVIDQLKKNEEIFLAKSQGDLEERLAVQNEVTRVYDLRVEGFDKNNQNKQELSTNLDALSFSIADQHIQENKYERASILKQNQEFTYYEDDYRNIHKEKYAEYMTIADKIDEIRIDYDEMQNKKNLQAVEKWQTNDGKFSDYSDDQYEDYQRAIELRKTNEAFIKEQTYFQDEQRQVSNADNYNKILSIQSDATDIEREIAAKNADKTQVQAEITKDILALEKIVADKNQKESRDLLEKQLEVDELVTAAYDRYIELTENADEGRIATIAELKKNEEGFELQKQARDERKLAAVRDTEADVLEVLKMNEKHLREMNDDAVETANKIDAIDNKLKRQSEFDRAEDARARQKTMDEVDNTNILQNKLHSEKKAKTEENNERIKNMDISTEKRKQAESQKYGDRRLNNQQKIDEEAQREREEKPIIANTLGDEYPEGVSQETYVTKDKDGLPVKLITRRIVVLEGRGIEYRRIETRNGIAYSKNGEAITEDVWNKDTMNGKLEKHF